MEDDKRGKRKKKRKSTEAERRENKHNKREEREASKYMNDKKREHESGEDTRRATNGERKGKRKENRGGVEGK